MRVLVLFGGRSGEHEVSVISARSVADALSSLGHEMIGVGITRDGRWVRAEPDAAPRVTDGEPFAFRADAGSMSDVCDVAFPVLHGPHGEDGSIQGLFELADLPYVGAGVEGSVIGINKWLQKKMFVGAGLPVVNFYALARNAYEDDVKWLDIISDRIGFPCFVKPSRLGSSVGISRVAQREDLDAAVERAFRHDDLILIEAQGHPRELEVGVLGDPPKVSNVGEIVADGAFYDYRSKYLGDWTELSIPADIPGSVEEKIKDLASLAFRCTSCEGMARVDFFFDPATESLLVNEINTVPGMTPNSMFPRIWDASGKPFPEVVRSLLDHAITRHERKAKLEAARAAAHDEEISGA
jgi:D-alanine-D-alanine ligase